MLFPRDFYSRIFDDLMDDAFGRDFFDDPWFRKDRPSMIGDGSNEAPKDETKPEVVPAKYERGMRGFGGLRTDIKETENGYELSVDLPGYVKDDVSIKLDKGYLTISASKNETKEDKDENGYIRKERYLGQRSRSYFVGKHVKPEDIKAKMENGVLTVDFPKAEPAEETASDILIEG